MDDAERKLVADVERHGWHVVLLEAADGLPGWAFTVGLTHSFGTPELAMFGLPTATMHRCLNTLGEVAREGGTFQSGFRSPEVLDGFDVELRAVDPAWHRALFGFARWFYRPEEPAFLQCAWPDLAQRFPWEPAFEDRIRYLQPALWSSPAEARNDVWRAWWHATEWPGRNNAGGLVFVSKQVAAGKVPVLGVQVFEDGDWAFLDGISSEPENMTMTHLHLVLQRDPSLEEMVDMAPGTWAWRDRPGEPWRVSALPDSGEAAAAPEGD
jgi:hypothetical protein